MCLYKQYNKNLKKMCSWLGSDCKNLLIKTKNRWFKKYATAFVIICAVLFASNTNAESVDECRQTKTDIECYNVI